MGQNTPFATRDAVASIHIIMDRMTGKTYDCYVEVSSTDAAQSFVNSRTNSRQAQPLLDRIPTVEMSCLDQLLENLFPKARSMQWMQGQPILRAGESVDSPFRALVTQEEMATTVRYAESPQRVSEAIISCTGPC